MKKVTLLACLLALAVSASAQNQQSVSRIAIPPNARGGEKPNAINGVTRSHSAAASEAATAKAVPNGGPQEPPIAKAPPNAVHAGPTARK
jgi:hypothetical protein